MLKKLDKIKSESAAIFLEYSLLLAMMMMVLSVMLPGGPVYETIRQELLMRISIISLPIF